MKIIGYIVVFAAGLVACYLLISLGVVDAIDGIPGTQQEPALSLPTYLSFVTVLLTSVTVVLASVAIGIGVVAAYTFREIKAEARSVANSTAEARVKEALTDQVIMARVDEVAFGNMRPSPLGELEEDLAPDNEGDQ